MPVKKYRAAPIIALLLTIATSNVAASQSLPLYTPETLPELGKSSGYVLIGVDSGDTESSLSIQKLKSKGREPLRTRRKPVGTDGSYKIDLAGKATGLYFAVLPKGLYQITEVSYPYFNLPFRLSTENQREWRFYIEENKINYVGQLVLARERSENSVDVNLLNRIATQIDNINSQYQTLLDQFPLASGVGVRDDFFEFIQLP